VVFPVKGRTVMPLLGRLVVPPAGRAVTPVLGLAVVPVFGRITMFPSVLPTATAIWLTWATAAVPVTGMKNTPAPVARLGAWLTVADPV
jgi:hypothetical protein